MNTNLLTKDVSVLEANLSKAQKKVRGAKAEEQKFRRALAAVSRKQDTHRKATLGALLLAAVARQPSTLPALRNLLHPLVTREIDWIALASTPFAREAAHE